MVDTLKPRRDARLKCVYITIRKRAIAGSGWAQGITRVIIYTHIIRKRARIILLKFASEIKQ